MWKRLLVMYPLFLSHCNETLIFSTDFRKSLHIKFHQNLSSGSRVVSCGRMGRQTDMTKLIVAFGNFVNAPKNCIYVKVGTFNWGKVWWHSIHTLLASHTSTVRIYRVTILKTHVLYTQCVSQREEHNSDGNWNESAEWNIQLRERE